MSIETVLARVDEDLAAGHLPLARQRLKSLVGSFPQRLDLRERLAELYRRDGDLAQAGRWSYLADSRERAEIAAFEKAHGESPIQMMKALGWRGAEDEASSEVAHDRLRGLRSRAEAEFGVPLDWELARHTAQPPPTVIDRIKEGGCLIAVLLLVLLILIGLGNALAEGLSVVERWLG